MSDFSFNYQEVTGKLSHKKEETFLLEIRKLELRHPRIKAICPH